MRWASLPVMALAVLLLGAGPLQAEAPRLDGERRAALADLPRLHGPPVTEAALAGKVVIVAFFASWCPPCHPEFDNLTKAQRTFGGELAIVAVNIFEVWGAFTGTARRAAFLARKDPPFHVVGDGEAVAGLFAGVTRIPTLLVFAADGAPLLHFVHEEGATKTHASFEEIAAAVRAALNG